MPQFTIAVASKGCCPMCLSLCPKDEDGWYECQACTWRFRVTGILPNGQAELVCQEPAAEYAKKKAMVILGVNKIDPNQVQQ